MLKFCVGFNLYELSGLCVIIKFGGYFNINFSQSQICEVSLTISLIWGLITQLGYVEVNNKIITSMLQRTAKTNLNKHSNTFNQNKYLTKT